MPPPLAALVSIIPILADNISTDQSNGLVTATAITGAATVICGILALFATRTKAERAEHTPHSHSAMEAVLSEIKDLRRQRDALIRKLDREQRENARLVRICYNNGIDPGQPATVSRSD